MKIDWKRKLTSRKLWIALAGFISGVIVACGGTQTTATTVSGVILQGASVIGYLLAEGLTDAARKDDSNPDQPTAQPTAVIGFDLGGEDDGE